MKATLTCWSLMTLLAAASPAAEKGATKLLGDDRATTRRADPPTYSSFDRPEAGGDKEFLPKGGLKLVDADLAAVLKLYQEISGRTVIRAGNLPAATINLQNETPLSRREVLQTLDTALAANQIAMVLRGTKFVKAVPVAQAHAEAGPVIDLPPDQLPDSDSYMVYVIKLKHLDPVEAMPAVQPFSKLPNSIVAIRSSGVLIFRDYSANVQRLLRVLEKLDTTE